MNSTASWRIGRIAGAEIRLRPSLLLMALAVIVLFERRFTGWSEASPALLGGCLVAGLYLSVFGHELAHLAVARLLGYRVEALTLHFFGGETHVASEARLPWHEFSIAFSGPLASGVIAAFTGLLAGAVPAADAVVVLTLLAWLNLLLAVLNLLPGLPLDGGRVVFALLWAVTGTRPLAMRLTAATGRAFGVALVLLGAAALATGRISMSEAAILGVVAAFLWFGAAPAARIARREQRLATLVATELSVPDDPGPGPADRYPPIPLDASGAALIQAIERLPAEVYRVVDGEGRTRGFLRAADVVAAYRKGVS